MLRFLILSIFTTVSIFSLSAQPLWSCDGSVIFALDGKMYINRTVPGDLDISLEELPLPSFGNINAIAYRRTDNCIYGVDYNVQELRRIFRLSPLGEYEIIDTIPDFDGGLAAATMSFDDQYLILPHGGNFILVDVTDNSANPVVISLSRDDLTYFFVDMALDAYTGKIHGYSIDTQGFVSVDGLSGLVEDYYELPLGPDALSVPGMGFADNQMLIGISSNPPNNIIGFYHPNSQTLIDKVEGTIAFQITENIDGCSCVDFDFALQQTLSSDTLRHCQTATAVIHVINRSREPLSGNGFFLKDTFPAGVIIEEVLYNPYGGEEEGIGTNIFHLNNFTPDFGIDSIVLQLTITEDALLGAHEVQALMEGFTDLVAYPNGSLKSDNPKTYESKMDATTFEILGSDSLATVQTQYYICPDSFLIINPAGGQSGYHLIWEDGSTLVPRLFTEAGQYTATISDACIAREFEIVIEEVYLAASIGQDQSIVFGEQVNISAQIEHDLPLYTYTWLVNDALVEFCTDVCNDFNFTFEESGVIELLVVDENGCSTQAKMRVKVDFPFFMPNVFSPNNDGTNDRFYPQSLSPISFKDFRIFDRWGGLLFEQPSGYSNDPLLGWDGVSGLKEAEQGVYLWEITLQLGSSKTEKHFSGGVTLLK